MKKTLLRSMIIGAAAIAPVVSFAGGVEVSPCCNPPRVDIPNMPAGFGFTIEGSALRGYNNDLNYLSFTTIDSISTIATSEVLNSSLFDQISPVYAFGLRVGIDYTLADSANVIKLYYEHLFNRKATSDAEFAFGETLVSLGEDPIVNLGFEGEAKQKFDGVTLLSEQHILIGPYWETTISGGVRFAHLGQELNVEEAQVVSSPTTLIQVGDALASYNMQFNGVGPLVGIGGLFHYTETLGIGADMQGALLMGRNTIDASLSGLSFSRGAPALTMAPAGIFTSSGVATAEIDDIYSVVPELFYRIYANYNHHFNDGAQLEIEAGWRANQFFNVRTFQTGAPSLRAGAVLNAGTTVSDDIGFSGPYLLVHYKL